MIFNQYIVKIFKVWSVWIDTYMYYVQFMFYMHYNNQYCDSKHLKNVDTCKCEI